MTMWTAEAYEQCIKTLSLHRYFQKTGAWLTVDGSDDNLVRPEGLPTYVVPSIAECGGDDDVSASGDNDNEEDDDDDDDTCTAELDQDENSSTNDAQARDGRPELDAGVDVKNDDENDDDPEWGHIGHNTMVDCDLFDDEGEMAPSSDRNNNSSTASTSSRSDDNNKHDVDDVISFADATPEGWIPATSPPTLTSAVVGSKIMFRWSSCWTAGKVRRWYTSHKRGYNVGLRMDGHTWDHQLNLRNYA
jgi:hypothetical protein